MEAIHSNIEEIISKNEKIIDIWARRTPGFEKRYVLKKEDATKNGKSEGVIRKLSDYGIGASAHTENKGKILGAGYEPLIIAFFIGLYSNKKMPLTDDVDEIQERGCGQAIQFWGNLDSKKNRHAYSGLRSYIFVALVAKTDIDWIALDKGEIKVNTVVSQLMKSMEEYINYGLMVMQDKLDEDEGYFYSNRSLLDLFLQLTKVKEESNNDDIEEL